MQQGHVDQGLSLLDRINSHDEVKIRGMLQRFGQPSRHWKTGVVLPPSRSFRSRWLPIWHYLMSFWTSRTKTAHNPNSIIALLGCKPV